MAWETLCFEPYKDTGLIKNIVGAIHFILCTSAYLIHPTALVSGESVTGLELKYLHCLLTLQLCHI